MKRPLSPAGRAVGLGDALDQLAELGGGLFVATEALGHEGTVNAGLLEALDDVRRNEALGLELLPALPDVLQEIVQTGRRIGGIAVPGLFDSH